MVARARRQTAGVSLPEVLVALLVGLLVLQLGLETLARLRSAQASLSARADALVALRVGSHVLRRELRHGLPGRDWAAAGDSLAIRAFRATAVVCASDSAAAQLSVSYRGDRAPDPSKDSVLVVTAEGLTTVHALVGVGATSSTCAPPGVAARLQLDRGAPSRAVLARVFERGSYHLSDAALRYRRGSSGRQPLTPEVWSSATAWELSGERLGIDMVPSTAGAAAWSGFLAWRTPD